MRIRFLVVAVTAALATTVAPTVAAPPSDWDDLGLPHADASQVYFRGNAMPWPDELTAYATTADSALVMSGEPGTSESLLTELPAGAGEPRTLDSYLFGIPIGDVAGHRVFWTSKVGRGKFRLNSYDTSTGTTYRHPTGAEQWTVFAVDADTAYALPLDASTTQWRTWTPGPEDAGLQVLGIPLADDAFITDASAGNLGVIPTWDSDTETVLGPDGTELATGLKGWATLDPSGSYASVLRKWGVRVYDIVRDRSMKLSGLRGRRWFSPVWSAGGDLVVTTYTRKHDEHHWDDAHRIRRYRCPMPADGPVVACEELVEAPPQVVWLDPTYGVTALDQFLATVDFE